MSREYISKKNMKTILGWWIADFDRQKCVKVTDTMQLGATGEWHDRGPAYFKKISEVEYETTYGVCYCHVYKNIEDCKDAIIKHIEKDIPHYEREAKSAGPQHIFAWLSSKKNSEWFIKEFHKKCERGRQFAKNQLENIQEEIRNVRECGDSKYSEIYDRRAKETIERLRIEHEEEIRVKAYYIAEKDGFSKNPNDYWHQAVYEDKTIYE